MIEDLIGCEKDNTPINYNLETHVPISIDVKPALIVLHSSKDCKWMKDIGYNPYCKQETPDIHLTNTPYDNLRFKRPAYSFSSTFSTSEWKHGIIWVERKKFKDLAYGFNGLLWDTMGQWSVMIDITDQFNQFQQTVLKPYWLNHFKPINKEENDTNRTQKSDNLDSQWNNRRYFMDCYSISWNKRKDRVFYQYNVHLDDTKQVAPFATFSTVTNFYS